MPAPDVVLVGPYPGPGLRHGGWTGVASYTANLAQALAGEGAQVEVVAPREPGLGTGHQDGAVRVRRVFARGATAVPSALRAAAACRPGAVHLQHETFLYGGPEHLPGLIGALAARRGRRGRRGRTVVTLHHVVDPATVDRAFTRMHRVGAPARLVRAGLGSVTGAIRRLADAVVVHEPAFVHTVPGAVVVPHGVEPSPEPEPADRAALGLDPDRLVALCFGFVAPYKGLEDALEAGRRAQRDVQVVVAGGEHPRLAGRDDFLQRLQAAHGAHARFTGFVPEERVPALFAAADVALFPYPRPMASSGALALALKHGTPALLSPELAATIQAPRAMTAPRDPDGLARRLRVVAGDAAARAALGRATAALAAGRSWPAVARRHLELYRAVA